MDPRRRSFLRTTGALGIAAVAGRNAAQAARNTGTAEIDPMGVLVDVPNCIGCRKCEFACRKAAGFDVPPIESFEDKSPMARPRRPEPRSYTVINQYAAPPGQANPVYVKVNCLHCNEPACASACLVGALTKRADGPVVYDAKKCMGCRYCMVACPFQIPTYDYDAPLTPQVRKCNLCAHLVPDEQPVPACVRICPRECLIYGRRSELLDLAREKIRDHPGKYSDHVYGEHEVGGTSWLYLAPRRFDELGFLNLPDDPPSRRTEVVQHGIFKFFMPPVALFGLLGIIMSITRRDRVGGGGDAGKPAEHGTAAQAEACGSRKTPVGNRCHTAEACGSGKTPVGNRCHTAEACGSGESPAGNRCHTADARGSDGEVT